MTLLKLKLSSSRQTLEELEIQAQGLLKLRSKALDADVSVQENHQDQVHRSAIPIKGPSLELIRDTNPDRTGCRRAAAPVEQRSAKGFQVVLSSQQYPLPSQQLRHLGFMLNRLIATIYQWHWSQCSIKNCQDLHAHHHIECTSQVMNILCSDHQDFLGQQLSNKCST